MITEILMYTGIWFILILVLLATVYARRKK